MLLLRDKSLVDFDTLYINKNQFAKKLGSMFIQYYEVFFFHHLLRHIRSAFTTYACVM